MVQDEILRLISKEEGYDIEFKESLSGLQSEDMVAFANSMAGGTILIGVRDDKDENGRQVGKIIGCEVGDKGRLTILDKANSCRPPVNVEISSSDFDGKSIYIIEIRSGEFKPYCTNSGTYRIRGDGQKRSLYPNELLSLFMESEKNKFMNSFKDATRELEENLHTTRELLLKETSGMVQRLHDFDKSMTSMLDDIYSSADNADNNSSSVESTVGNIESTVDEIWGVLFGVAYLLPRIDSNLKNQRDQTFDPKPFITESFNRFTSRLGSSKWLINNQKNVLKKLFPDVSEQELNKLFQGLDV
ncbi:ATP-binding protein [Gorillibacterium sp. CAU 1737]|uniref:AlbA family DNA-binding domain-containing protein n=1 Tax=Gorillibacterium sp. CAU 1737 TaxID=3140362 RepID=UPI0032611A22